MTPALTVNPTLLVLLVVLMAMLFMSVGVRRRFNARRPMQAIVATYRAMARRHPRRFAPGLAMNLRLLAVELAEAGDIARALIVIMEASDIYRALAAERPDRFTEAYQETRRMEEAMMAAVGISPDADLRGLMDEVEADLRRRRSWTWRDRLEAFYWRIALWIWGLSVFIFLWVGYLKPLL
ncbi:MAG: hypothetical protein ACLFWF_11470 [Alphaproteobacteria bacterium]